MPFQSRFGKAADAYCAYRPGYPPALYERILAALRTERRAVAMDLGAGSGQATRGVGEHFTEVIAVEPDPLIAGKLRVAEPRASVRVTTAEECEQGPTSVDAVIIAAALHWMDVPRVIANVERWLRPGWVLAVCGGGLPTTPEPVAAVLQQEFAERWDKFRDERLRRKEFPQSILRAAKELRMVEETTIEQIVPMTAGDFAGFWRSTSYGSAYGRSIQNEENYWRRLEQRFRAAWPEERIPVDFSPWLFVMRKE